MDSELFFIWKAFESMIKEMDSWFVAHPKKERVSAQFINLQFFHYRY